MFIRPWFPVKSSLLQAVSRVRSSVYIIWSFTLWESLIVLINSSANSVIEFSWISKVFNPDRRILSIVSKFIRISWLNVWWIWDTTFLHQAMCRVRSSVDIIRCISLWESLVILIGSTANSIIKLSRIGKVFNPDRRILTIMVKFLWVNWINIRWIWNTLLN
jgi:hypothetical protein